MIRIGPAGWKYKDWEGVVYPEPAPRGFDPLAYIAEYFTTVEINSSYYGPPQPASARRWVNSVGHNRNFRFTAKLFHSFTHERKPGPTDERDYKTGIGPIAEADRLGAILIQFPWSFKNEPHNLEYLWALQKRFQEYPLVVEVRHASWITEEILDTFAALGLGLCNIDQPLFHRSVKPAARTTSAVGYVRLHGRNYQNWFLQKRMFALGTTTYTVLKNWSRGLRASSKSPRIRRIRTPLRTITTWEKPQSTPWSWRRS